MLSLDYLVILILTHKETGCSHQWQAKDTPQDIINGNMFQGKQDIFNQPRSDSQINGKCHAYSGKHPDNPTTVGLFRKVLHQTLGKPVIGYFLFVLTEKCFQHVVCYIRFHILLLLSKPLIFLFPSEYKS